MNILISGAGGFLGSHLIQQLLEKDKDKVLAFTSKPDKLMDRFNNHRNLTTYANKEDVPFKEVDLLINCAFARTSDGLQLASSLDFTNEFISYAADHVVGGIINISSQSVYSQKREEEATEETEICPESLYGVTKYATEILISNICENAKVPYSHLRLGSLAGVGFDARLTNRFIKSAINGQTINIKGGKQIISYMDVRDAASGLVAISSVEPSKWKRVYNFGTDESHRLIEIAHLVKSVAPEFISTEVKVELEEGDNFINLSMDNSRFYQATSWNPQYSMEDTIRQIFKDLVKK